MSKSSFDMGVYLYGVVASVDRRNFDEIEECLETFKREDSRLNVGEVYSGFKSAAKDAGKTLSESSAMYKKFTEAYELHG